MLNFASEEMAKLRKADAYFLRRLFSSVHIRDTVAPKCELLFVYADLTADGGIVGSKLSLREIIRDSGAQVVVVASDNAVANYIKAAAHQSYGHTNLIMTLNRRGDAFERFFVSLFTKMKNGTPMPEAWVELSPQVSSESDNGNPEMLFVCEIGPLCFA